MTVHSAPKNPGGVSRRRALACVLAGVVLLALGLRVAHLCALQGWETLRTAELTPDASYNDWWARSGGAGDRQPYYVAPLYMEALRGLYGLAGPASLGARIVQILLGSISPLLAYWVARKLSDGRVALLAAILCALNPLYIMYEATLTNASVCVFMALLAMGVAMTACQARKRQYRWWLLAGAMTGALCLIRPNVLLFLPLAGLAILWRGRARLSVGLACCGAWLLGAVLAIAPVTARNLIVAGDAVLISSNGGFSFYLGNRPGAGPIYGPAPGVAATLGGEAADAKRLAEKALGRELKASEVSRFYYARGLAAIADDPRVFLWRAGLKAMFVVNDVEVPNTEHFYYMRQFSPVLRNPALGFGILLPWALIGMVLCRRSHPGSVLVNLFILSNVVGLVLFYVCARYRLPITPFVIIYASAGLVWAWDTAVAKRFGRLAIGAAVIVAGNFVSHIDLADGCKADYSTPLFNAANYYMGQGRMEEALARLTEIDRAGGRSARVLEAMGRCHMDLKQYRQAGACLDEAVAFDPKGYSAYFQRGRLLLLGNHLEAARRDFQEVLRLNDTVAEAYHYLGAIDRQQGRPEQAMANLAKARRLDPNIVVVYVELARVLRDQGRLYDARRAVRDGLARAPDDAELLKLRSELYDRLQGPP